MEQEDSCCVLPSTLECNFKLNCMTRNWNSVNKDYELKTQYFTSQIIKITCPAVVLEVVQPCDVVAMLCGNH